MSLIKKAIFPVAGIGSRFLPATKATPKEMLPIVDKPLIQYAVEEAVSIGITELIFITNYINYESYKPNLSTICRSLNKRYSFSIVLNDATSMPGNKSASRL